MIIKPKNHSTRKIVRYAGGSATLLILASFLYQWNNGLVVDDTETFRFHASLHWFPNYLLTY